MSELKRQAEQEALTVMGTVKPEWIDPNGHMNVAYYLLAFDVAMDTLWHHVGITSEYVTVRKGSTFAVEAHITYQRELMEGDMYRVETRLLAIDDKRLHQFQYMYHADDGYLAATAEWLNLHVSLETRRVCPWPNEILSSFTTIAHAQSDTGMPSEVGKKMQIKRPSFSLPGYPSDNEQ